MPSSIFSFDRVPEIRYQRIVLTTVLAVVAIVILLEVFWRAQGHRASVTDDPLWWAIHRQSPVLADPNAVVVIGASRTQLGFSSEIFHERFPNRPLVRLEIAGKGPFELLEDLAHDESFSGTIICSTAPSGDVGRTTLVDYLPISKEYISTDRKVNRAVSAWLQNTFAFLCAEVGTRSVVRHLVEEGCLPHPRYIATSYDRSRAADFDLWRGPDSPQIRRQRVIRWVHKWGFDDNNRWTQRVAEVELLVQRIQQRGGKVVFVTMPLSDVFYSMTASAYPKYRYWDKFAELTKGVPIHCRDISTLRDFKCPDGSHLDQSDIPKFTNAFLDVLGERGVLVSSTRSPRRLGPVAQGKR